MSSTTVTPNIGLQLPAYGSTGWQVPFYFNMNLLDQVVGGLQSAYQGQWSNQVTYIMGQWVTYKNTVYISAQNANVGNEPDTATAWWTKVTVQYTYRGAWAANTAYNAYDNYLENGNIYLVDTAYTSGATFGTLDTENTAIFLPQGPTGLQGKSLNNRGAWAANTAYNATSTEIDFYLAPNGSSYIVLASYTSGATFGTADTTNCQVLAGAGALSGNVTTLLTASAGAAITGGASVTGGLAADTVTSNDLVEFPYPNTEGWTHVSLDKNGNVVGALTEPGGIYSPTTPALPAGSIISGSDLGLPGKLILTDEITTPTLVPFPYPNTEGYVFPIVDNNEKALAAVNEFGELVANEIPEDDGAALTVIADPNNEVTPPLAVYQSVDSSGNPQIAAIHAVEGAYAVTAPAEVLLTSTSKNIAPTLNADNTISFITNRTGTNRRFKMNSDGTSPFYEEYFPSQAQFLSTAAHLWHLLLTGQSLSTGTDGTPPVSNTQPFANLMFNTGVNATTNGASGVSLEPLLATSGGANGVETVANGMCDAITASARSVLHDNPSGLTSRDILVSGSGIGGQPYLNICGPTDAPPNGTASYLEFVSQIQKGQSLAPSGAFIPGIINIHGQSDDGSGVPQTYLTDLIHWQSDLQAAVHANTPQTDVVPFYMAQVASWASFNNRLFPTTALSQVMAATEYPTLFKIVAPLYPFPTVSYATTAAGTPASNDTWGSGYVHLLPDGYRWLGEQYAKVLRYEQMEQKQWLPLCPLKMVRTGVVIAVDFHNPSGTQFVWDTNHVNMTGLNNYGFEYYDSLQSAIIVSVAFDPVIANRVNVTLSNVPYGYNQRLRYAYTPPQGTGNNNTGMGSGPRGCLRDSDATMSYYNSTITLNMLTAGQHYPMWNWCTTFDYQLQAI